MNKIELALASDEKFASGLLVSVASIARYAAREVELSFHILDGGIKESTFAHIVEKVEAQHPHVLFKRHAVNEEMFKNFPPWPGGRMTYARILLPSLLPDSDFVLYVDSDALFLKDVNELWKMRSSDVLLKGVLDGVQSSLDAERKWNLDRGLPFDPDHYICGGLALYNLRLMREGGFEQKLMRFLDEHRDVFAVDQSAVNAVFYGQIETVAEEWFTHSYKISYPISCPLPNIHYSGGKPWPRVINKNIFFSDLQLYWYSMLDVIEGVPKGTMLKRDYSCGERFVMGAVMRFIVRHPLVKKMYFRLAEKLLGMDSSYRQTFELTHHDISCEDMDIPDGPQ